MARVRTWRSGVGWPMRWQWYAQDGDGGLMAHGDSERKAREALRQLKARLKRAMQVAAKDPNLTTGLLDFAKKLAAWRKEQGR